jgi:hypothetical protein
MSRLRFDLVVKDLSLDMPHLLKQFAHYESEHISLASGHPMFSAGRWGDISFLPIMGAGGAEAFKAALLGKFLTRDWSVLGWEDFCLRFQPWEKEPTREGKMQMIQCLESLQIFLECIFSEEFFEVFQRIIEALKDSKRPMRFFHDIFVAATVWGAIGRFFYGVAESVLSINGLPQRNPSDLRRVLLCVLLIKPCGDFSDLCLHPTEFVN